jgi:signal peptidase I
MRRPPPLSSHRHEEHRRHRPDRRDRGRPAPGSMAPAPLGGATRYAVVEGASMEPALSRGDLVLVRAGGDPTVGDVVLYRDPEMGVRVLHRVTSIESGRLVLQGDANDFVDDARPLPSEVIGSYWFSIPRAGAMLLWLARPLHAALLAFVLTIVALTGGGAARPAPRGEASRG